METVNCTQEKYEYLAFISYNRKDKKIAGKIQDRIEYYKLPTAARLEINDRLKSEFNELPARMPRLFRDETELEPGQELSEAIKKALDESKFLIVICSPNSAQSFWVNEEAKYFIEMGRADRIIPIIIAGEAHSKDLTKECFPPVLLQNSGDKEILAANIYEAGGLPAATIKIIARMLGLRFDSLWRRYEKNQARKRNLSIASVIAIFIIGFGVWQYVANQKNEASQARYERQAQFLLTQYLECEKLFNSSQYLESFRMAQKILKENSNMSDSIHDKYEFLLRSSYMKLNSDTLGLIRKYKMEFYPMDWGGMPVLFSKDGSTVYVGCGGLSAVDLNSGKNINGNDEWPRQIRENDTEILTFDDYEVNIYNKYDFKLKRTVKMPRGISQNVVSCSTDGSRFLISRSDPDQFDVYSTFSGQIVRSFPALSHYGSLSGDGKIFATIENERLRLFSVDSGEPLETEALGNAYATNLQFDESGRWLLLDLTQSKVVRAINLSTGEDYIIGNDRTEVSLGNSLNHFGDMYSDKYYVSDDNAYICIDNRIYEMSSGILVKQLEGTDIADAVKIYPDARKVVQVNYDQTAYEYTRNGSDLFKNTTLDFEVLLDTDNSSERLGIKTDGNDYLFYNKNKLIGKISLPYSEVYHISVTRDNQYAVVSANDLNTTLYRISTGLPLEQYPFTSGDGHTGFGIAGKDNIIYFCGLNTVYQYQMPTLEYLLSIER